MRIDQMSPEYGVEEAKAAYDLIMSGSWLSDFKKCREAEQVICQYTGAKFAVLVPNGTIGLQIAMMAYMDGMFDTVIVPDYTMAATPYAASLNGYMVELVDVSLEDQGIDWDQIKPRMHTIITPVPLSGRACNKSLDYDAAVKYMKSKEAAIIEDACQDLGSFYKGKHLGTFGDMGVLSFNTFKIISSGQGGVIITDNEILYKEVKKIKDFGRSGGRGSSYEILGMNAKFTDLQAAILLEQFKKLSGRVSAKRKIYHQYQEHLKDIEQIKWFNTDLTQCTPWYVDPLVEKRDELIEYLSKNEIEAQPFYPPIHRLAYYKGLGYVDADFPNACYISEHGIWLPSSSSLKEDDINRVCEAIIKFYSK